MSDLAVLAKDMDFSDADIKHMLDNLDSFNSDELAEIDKIVGELSTPCAAGNDFCQVAVPTCVQALFDFL